MPTIIDSLLVTLGLDPTAYNAGKAKVDKGLKDTGGEADKTGAKLKKSGKDGADGFKETAASLTKFLAIIGGTVAVKRFIEQTIESNAALDRLSKNLQENVESISAWSNATELAGGTADGLQGTLDMLSKAQTDLMLTGQSQLIPYFSALGVSIADSSGKARAGSDILLDLSDRFSKMDRTTANNMGRMMGIDQGTLNLLLKGRSEVESMIRRQKEYGVVTKQQVEEATRLNVAMVESKQTFMAWGRELLSAATPALEGLFGLMKDFGAWVRDNKEFVNAFLIIIATGLGAVAAATIPINLTVAAVIALAGAIALLWQDYQTWKRGGDSFIDWAKWEPGFTAATAAIKGLKTLLNDLVYRAIAAADMLSAVFNRDWDRAKFAAGEFLKGADKPVESVPQGVTEPVAKVGADGKRPQQRGVEPTQSQDNQWSALAYFQSKGWSKEQAAGLAANIKRESTFNPEAVGDNGSAYGIAQWHPDRQADFKKKFGKDIRGSSLEDQMAFMHYELTEGKEKPAGDKLRQTTSAQEAAVAVSRYYERPDDKTGSEAAKRSQLAQGIVDPRSYVAKAEAAGIVMPAPIPRAAYEQAKAARASLLLQGTPGASQAAQGAGAPQVAQANAPVTGQGGASSVDTKIGEIKIYTEATDADGIAKDIGKSINSLFTSQANYGMVS